MSTHQTMAFDFVARQKVQGQTLNLFIVEHLPVIAPDGYNRSIGATTARDLGHDGPPFPCDEEERRHLRAGLDALYFHLYGLIREDAAYVLATFPIVRRQDQAAFGRYRTNELTLAYMHALAAGDAETTVAV